MNVVEHANGAGDSVVTAFLDDLDAHVAAVAAGGLEPDERVTLANGVRMLLYHDPDGNELDSAARRSTPVRWNSIGKVALLPLPRCESDGARSSVRWQARTSRRHA